jgi:signal transduction histidine kinase
MKHFFLILALITGLTTISATEDYKQSAEFIALQDSMRHAFNDGDSAIFFPALQRLEDYLLKQGDLHAYYNQRCNEIVFLMNQQRIFEAFKLASNLSRELQERKLDKEMYMAYNMLGHINLYCGNKETAKENFYKAISMMEKAGYYENMPPIYMNIVNVSIDDDPAEAEQLLNKAAEIAQKYSPDRVFDIEARRTLSFFNGGDMKRFVEGYEAYRKGVAEGKSSVHGRTMEIYYQTYLGNTDRAIEMAKESFGSEASETVTMVYERAGRWKEAYASLKQAAAANDSVNNVVLSNSMLGYRDELAVYDLERQTTKARTITMAIIILLLCLLIVALIYITMSRRRHMKELTRAYEHALESDKMKSAFIQNMSHEVRTPLNVISGFAQVLANPEMSGDPERRQEIARMMLQNTRIITDQIDEMLVLSMNESSGAANRDDQVVANEWLSQLVEACIPHVSKDVKLVFDNQLPAGFIFKTHSDMLRRLLNALFDNAIKNTIEGSITLRAKADDSRLTLMVEDTGCGIPAKEAERIFERFVKLDNFKSGLGLGLSVCRLMTNRLGGNIKLDTNYTGGARFVVNLPL